MFNFDDVKKAARFALNVETVTALNSQNEAKTNFTESNFGGFIPYEIKYDKNKMHLKHFLYSLKKFLITVILSFLKRKRFGAF